MTTAAILQQRQSIDLAELSGNLRRRSTHLKKATTDLDDSESIKDELKESDNQYFNTVKPKETVESKPMNGLHKAFTIHHKRKNTAQLPAKR